VESVFERVMAGVVAKCLHERDLAVAGAVEAKFQLRGQVIGLDVTVRLQDPSQTETAKAALLERFGDDAGLTVFNVS
jgi:hypothetical protein